MSPLHLQCPEEKIPASVHWRHGLEPQTDLDSNPDSTLRMHVTSALIPSLENVESNMGTDNEIHTRAIMRADEIAG